MDQPLVSIVSLLYDVKVEYVNQCIDSILKQTYQNIEIIFVDDCSPTIDYSYITKLSPKIKLIRNKINLGFNRNSQKAFELATGKYVVKVDSDDYIAPTLIEKEVAILEADPEVGAVACELQRFGKQTALIKRPTDWSLEEALFKNMHRYGYEGGFMFRQELLKEVAIDPEFRVCTDFDFNMQILAKMKIKSIHEPLYFYRSHDSNIMISARGGERVRIVKKILEKHKKLYYKAHPIIYTPVVSSRRKKEKYF
ncbi:MAG: glycosyltransferase [Bacilli bacterium]|nr:glycosyltransferase [Bacilli bacterium]